MDIVERIAKLLKHQGISSSQFADEIGVQRSSMSHILSGRNKPSLDFVQKILKRYSFLQTDWLLFGKEPMTKEIKQRSLFEIEREPMVETLKKENEEKFLGKDNENAIRFSNPVPSPKTAKTVEFITVFYADGSCTTYNHDGKQGI